MEERRCLRCGAPYDEGATVCFTCGASIGELETPTQPVRAPKRPAPAPDPTPLEQPVEPAMAPMAPIATALSAAPRPQLVGSRFNAPTRPIPRPKRRGPLIASVVAVALVALVGIGLGVRALLAPPAPTTTTYHDPHQRFSFTSPALWIVTPQATGALVADSNGANTLTISVATPQVGQTAVSVADALASQQSLQSAASTSIGGDEWQQRVGRVTGLDGATRVVTLYVDVHNGSLYSIETSSPTSVASSVDTLVYQPLLASFAFK